MTNNTPNRGYTYPQSSDHDRLWEHFQELATDIDTDVQAIADTEDQSFFSITSMVPLVSAASTEAVVCTLANFAFKAGFAYEISYFFRTQFVGGTSPFASYSKIRRASASGTTIHDPGGVAHVGSGANIFAHYGSVIVKCTAGNTTQTLVATGAFQATGSPTSMNVVAGSTAAQRRLTCRRIGFAADYTDAIEIPTA